MVVNEDELIEESLNRFIEQEEIKVQSYKIWKEYSGRGFSWNRFRGDAICKIIKHYLEKHIPSAFKVIRLAWVEGCENEFDLLIVDKGAKPLGFTSAYSKHQVHLLIEVKSSGVFYRREEVEKTLSEKFEKWRQKTGKPILYLSLWEAHAHVQEVYRALGEDAFIFDVEKEGTQSDAWERFIEKVNEVLKSSRA